MTSLDLALVAGDDVEVGFSIKNGSDALDLSGATLFFTAKERIDSDDTDSLAVLRLDSGTGGIVIGSAVDGEATVKLPSVQTNLLTPGKSYFWDLRVHFGDGTKLTVYGGKLKASARVTRRDDGSGEGPDTPQAVFFRVDGNLAEIVDASAARENLGIGRVNNTSDAEKPVSAAVATALALKADASGMGSAAHHDAADFAPAAHVANFSNPHQVSAAQVGLGDVDNTRDAAKPVSSAVQAALDGKVGTADARLSDARVPRGHAASHGSGGSDEVTPAAIGAATAEQGAKADTALQSFVEEDPVAGAALAEHVADAGNPHQVSAAQVGLGNVDNTRDADKPVSNAVRAALAGKAALPQVITVTDDAARLALDAALLRIGDIVEQTAWTENPTNPGEYEHAVYGVINPGSVIPTERFAHFGTVTRVPAVDPNGVGPMISGGAFVGIPVTVLPGDWTDAPSLFEYQAQRSFDPFVEWIDTETAGASYVPVSGDSGAKLRFRVRASNAVGGSEWVFTNPTGEVSSNSFITGLVAYYPLSDEADASGNGNDLTNLNGVLFAPGKIGDGAVFFDGMALQCLKEIPSFNSFTVCCWFKWDGSGGTVVMVNQWPNNWVLLIEDGKLRAGVALNGVGFGLSSVSDAPIGEWAFGAIRYNGETGTLDVVLNGEITTSEYGAPAVTSGNDVFTIGQFSTGGYQFNGMIDEVAEWSRLLSNQEFVALYNNGDGAPVL